MTDSVPTWLMRAFQGAGLLCTLALGTLYAFQEKLLYVPVLPGVPNTYEYTPADYGFEYSDEWIVAQDGTNLQCWHIQAPGSGLNGNGEKPPVVLFFQENAGNMSFRLDFISLLARRLHCSVFVLGYRGYGKSDGSPSQRGLEMDADAALQHVLSRTDVDTSKVALYGKSLGGAVALYLAARSEKSLRAAIIENTFTSVENMVGEVFPVLRLLVGDRKPMNWLVRNKWKNQDRIQELTDLPLLLIGSQQDELVPFAHMQRLRQLSSSTESHWAMCPRGTHMDAYVRDERVYWDAVTTFWMRYMKSR